MPHLEGRVAIVTGGGTGIGRALARGLARHGATVVIASRREDVLRSTASELGERVFARGCDVRDLGSVQGLVHDTIERHGGVDIVVNNAGLAISERLDHVSNDHWDVVMDTNLRGAFWLMREALHHMKARNFGDVFNVSSQAGKHGYADVATYCAAKHALLGMGAALKAELAQDRQDIRVFNLCPGLVDVERVGDDEAPRPGFVHVRNMVKTVLYMLDLDRNVNVDDLGITSRS